jgi:hypothetical protein
LALGIVQNGVRRKFFASPRRLPRLLLEERFHLHALQMGN